MPAHRRKGFPEEEMLLTGGYPGSSQIFVAPPLPPHTHTYVSIHPSDLVGHPLCASPCAKNKRWVSVTWCHPQKPTCAENTPGALSTESEAQNHERAAAPLVRRCSQHCQPLPAPPSPEWEPTRGLLGHSLVPAGMKLAPARWLPTPASWQVSFSYFPISSLQVTPALEQYSPSERSAVLSLALSKLFNFLQRAGMEEGLSKYFCG